MYRAGVLEPRADGVGDPVTSLGRTESERAMSAVDRSISRGRVSGAAVVLVACLVTGLAGLASVAPASAATARTTVTVTAPATVAKGAAATVSGRVTPARPARYVVLQVKAGTRWTKVAAAKTRARGAYTLALPTARAGAAVYRVRVRPARGVATAAVSPVFTVAVTRNGAGTGGTGATGNSTGTGAGNGSDPDTTWGPDWTGYLEPRVTAVRYRAAQRVAGSPNTYRVWGEVDLVGHWVDSEGVTHDALTAVTYSNEVTVSDDWPDDSVVTQGARVLVMAWPMNSALTVPGGQRYQPGWDDGKDLTFTVEYPVSVAALRTLP